MKVIVVSTSSRTLTIFKDILNGPELKSIIGVTGILEAKQKLRQENYDLVIIQTPASDEFGTRGAMEIARSFHVGVILLVKQNLYDQVLYQTQESDVFTAGMPSTTQALYQAVQFCMVHRRYVGNLEQEIAKQKKKLQDEKLIARAKICLMQQNALTEEEAHHLIERRAMESSRPKALIAREILDQAY